MIKQLILGIILLSSSIAGAIWIHPLCFIFSVPSLVIIGSSFLKEENQK